MQQSREKIEAGDIASSRGLQYVMVVLDAAVAAAAVASARAGCSCSETAGGGWMWSSLSSSRGGGGQLLSWSLCCTLGPMDERPRL